MNFLCCRRFASLLVRPFAPRRARFWAAIVFLIFLASAPSVLAQAPTVAKASSIKTIYVMPSSHWDLGFIAPPEEVLLKLKPHIDEVIAHAKADPEFRWTIESVWQIREWLARTHDPKQVQEFVDLVKRGQVQVSAVFGSMHTEFMGAEELNRIAYDVKALERQLGIKTDFAMMDDVPGFTLRLPQVLARSGVHYFVNGSNLFLFGGTSLSPGKVPFYWESPDGSRVLTWQTQSRLGGYTEAMADYYLDPDSVEPYTKEHFYPKEWAGLSRLEIMQRGVDKLLAKYGQAGYPYDALLLLYLHDFISPDREANQLLPAVREWNAAGKQPRIVVATPAEFFRHMESAYGKDKFATYAGDWSGLWSEVKTNSPGISARARWLHDHLPVAEMLWSLLTFRNLTSFPAGNLEEARLKLLKYDEHSGAAQVGWPKLMSRAEVDEQNKEYVDYVESSRADVQYLIDSGVETLLSQKPQALPSVVVFNPLSWERSELVRIKLAPGLALRDRTTGQLVPLQRLGSDDAEFFAETVPSAGYRSYSIEPASSVAPASLGAEHIAEMENRFYRVRLRPSDGAMISIFDKELGRELVDSTSDQASNQLLRWIPAASLAAAMSGVEITREDGPVSTTLVVRRRGTFWPETRIRLERGRKNIEISNLLDRSRMPFVATNQAGEFYSFNFPFRFSGPARIWLEDGIGFHSIPEDYLPGARTDAGVPQHSLVLTGNSGGSPIQIVLSQKEAFFDYLPGLPGAKGQGDFLNAVRATVMRKQDQGEVRELGAVNFSTVEPGLPAESWYHFALSSSPGPLDAVEAYRRGWSLNVPLIASELSSSMSPAESSASFFTLSAPGVVVLAFKPSTDDNPEHYTLRLQEIEGKAQQIDLRTPLKITEAAETTLTEDEVLAAVAVNPLRLALAPHQTYTLRLTIPHAHKKRSERWWEWD